VEGKRSSSITEASEKGSNHDSFSKLTVLSHLPSQAFHQSQMEACCSNLGDPLCDSECQLAMVISPEVRWMENSF
jgi:hypothetical protein